VSPKYGKGVKSWTNRGGGFQWDVAQERGKGGREELILESRQVLRISREILYEKGESTTREEGEKEGGYHFLANAASLVGKKKEKATINLVLH